MMKIKMNNFCPKCGIEFSTRTLLYTGNNYWFDKNRIHECQGCGAKIKVIYDKAVKWLVLSIPIFVLPVISAWHINIEHPYLWYFAAFILFAGGAVLYATKIEYVEYKEDF
jgi:hypothetical protein